MERKKAYTALYMVVRCQMKGCNQHSSATADNLSDKHVSGCEAQLGVMPGA